MVAAAERAAGRAQVVDVDLEAVEAQPGDDLQPFDGPATVALTRLLAALDSGPKTTSTSCVGSVSGTEPSGSTPDTRPVLRRLRDFCRPTSNPMSKVWSIPASRFSQTRSV